MANRLMPSNWGNRGHIGLDRRCGLCADAILPREMVVGMSGNSTSTEYRGCTQPFLYPEHLGLAFLRLQTTVGHQGLCSNELACIVCSRLQGEYVTVHHDCVEIFKQHCTTNLDIALARLWVVATWRKPWRNAPALLHITPPMAMDGNILGTITRSAGLPPIERLPLELLEMVRSYSPKSLLWRCFPILQLAAQLSVASHDPPLFLPLAKILFWERGGRFEQVTSSRLTAHTTVRMSIDSAGIYKVERLSGWPVYDARESSARHAFIVQEQGDVADVVAHLKNGMLRLQVPRAPWDLVAWNTPTPPLGRYQPAEFASSKVRHVVNLEEARGITFFFILGQLMGIHVHRSGGSHPMDTAERMLNPGLYLAWLYLPLSREDPPLVLGVRTTWFGDLSILVRTQRAGGVILGRHYPRDTVHLEKPSDQILAASRPITMIYGEPAPGAQFRLFGAHPGLPEDAAAQPAPFSMEYPRPNPIGDFLVTYFSWAPLANVSSTVTFYDDAGGDCQGIVFHYEGGGARAVGQCRLQVDRSERVDRPARLCFRTETVEVRDRLTIYRVQARFEPQSPSKPDDDPGLPQGWEARPMRGVVKFWFGQWSGFLAVED